MLLRACALYPPHERWQIDAEGLRQSVEVHHPDVPPTPLDIADIARVEAGLLGQSFLGIAPLDPE